MLSTFLSQLQGYFSKYFVIGSFFPVLSFAVLNGLVGYLTFSRWQAWIDANIFKASAGSAAFTSTALVVAITLIAYVLYGLSTALRQVLEGRSWGRFGRLLIPAQSRRREYLRGKLQAVAMERADLDYAPNWISNMDEAREAGKHDHPAVAFDPPQPDAVDTELSALEDEMFNFREVKAARLEAQADEVAARLRGHDFDVSKRLLEQRQRLGRLIDYARERAPALYARLQNEMNANFGAQDVAPTNMGNVANSIQSYALRRYHCNLELIWSNLVRVAQNDDKMQATLLEAKTQLDFLVACCWLTLVSALFWATIFLWPVPSRAAFLAFALGGPFVAWLWYRAATEQYRSFADVAMTTLDTLRFDVLRAMRIRAPADVADERSVWENVDVLTTFGEDRNFRYDPPKA
jgi:hypothetical protein